MGKKSLTAQQRADLKTVFDEIGVENLKAWILAVAEGRVEGEGKKAKQVRAPNPGRAAELMLALAEYVKPKLARIENTGKDGSPLRIIVNQVKGGS